MEEVSQPKALDTILEYCVSKDGEHIYDHQIESNVFPELNVDQIRHLFKQIDDTIDEIAVVNINEDTAIIRSTGMTQTFLDQGGFVQVSLDEKNEEIESKERANIEFELAKSNIEANRLNIKVAKRNKKETVINIILGLINIGILIWQLLKPEST